MKIDILGTPYQIRQVSYGQDGYMSRMNYGGYCDGIRHEILVLKLKPCPDWKDEPEDRIRLQEQQTLRHELVHAFLNESGLKWNSFAPEKAWAENEEMVDWFASQAPKIYKAFQQAGAI